MKLKPIFLGILILFFFVSHLVSASPAEDDQPISITIASPGNGTKFYSDVVPHRVRVMANISSAYEIMKDSGGTKSIVVTAWDEKGNSVSETTTFTIITGAPPASLYTVYGLVTDSNGEPLQGCRVRINSSFFVHDAGGSTNVSDINGSYLVENIYGPKLMITAGKEGYQQYQSVEGFKSNSEGALVSTKVEFNIVMTPEEKESPGFGFIPLVVGISFAACLAIAGRRTE